MDNVKIASELIAVAKELTAFDRRTLESAFSDARNEFQRRIGVDLPSMANQPAWVDFQKQAGKVSEKAEELVMDGTMSEADVHQELVNKALLIMMLEAKALMEVFGNKVKSKGKLGGLRQERIKIDKVRPGDKVRVYNQAHSAWFTHVVSKVGKHGKFIVLYEGRTPFYRDAPDGVNKMYLVASQSRQAKHPLDGVRKHQLMPSAVARKIPKLYSMEEEEDPMAWVKFFSPYSNATWYITEFDGRDTMFGWADLGHGELGYISLRELESANKRGLPLVERDLYWKPRPLSRAKGS